MLNIVASDSCISFDSALSTSVSGISPAISSRVGLVENGLNRLKSNIDITAMASNNSANGGQNQVGEGRGQAKQPFNQQQHSPGLAGGGGDSGAGGGSIRCNKCNVEYSTKEARRLHTCNSILDQHYLSVENAGERTSNSNKSSSPNSPTGLHMPSAEARAAVQDLHERGAAAPQSLPARSVYLSNHVEGVIAFFQDNAVAVFLTIIF